MLREILNKSPHHWEDRKKERFYYLQSLKRELIPSVAIELNRLHKTNHSDSSGFDDRILAFTVFSGEL